MLKIERSYTLIPIIVANEEYFIKLAAHLGRSLIQWSWYAEFDIDKYSLETALMILQQQQPEFPGLSELKALLDNPGHISFKFWVKTSPAPSELDTQEIPF